MIKTCFACNRKVTGRTDKKFCSIPCKNDYHNSQKVKLGQAERYMLSAMRKNRMILEKLKINEPVEKPVSYLENMGFDRSGLSGLILNDDKSVQTTCYDYALVLRDNMALIYKMKQVHSEQTGSGK
jgi:hypothetical protein